VVAIAWVELMVQLDLVAKQELAAQLCLIARLEEISQLVSMVKRWSALQTKLTRHLQSNIVRLNSNLQRGPVLVSPVPAGVYLAALAIHRVKGRYFRHFPPQACLCVCRESSCSDEESPRWAWNFHSPAVRESFAMANE
jgi:hypothetical protein